LVDTKMTQKFPEKSINKTPLDGSLSKSKTEKKVDCWSTIKNIARDNPNLPESFIEDIILAQQEVAKGNVTPYKFG